jgi:hypothetical protein
VKYALLIHMAGAGQGGDRGFASDAYRKVLARLRAGGSFRGARRFASPAATTTVRTREGTPHVKPGPPIQTAEPLMGFVVVECAGEPEATQLASEVAVATGGVVVVRAVAPPGSGGSERSGVGESSAASARNKEYAFVINVAESERPWPGSPAFDDLMERCGKVLDRLEGLSRFRGTERLAPAAKAKAIRTTGGRPSITDGPFTEARELIGGFILGECESVEEAVELAGAIPAAAAGSVEVREVVREG